MTEEENKAIEYLKEEIKSLEKAKIEFSNEIEDKGWLQKNINELDNDIFYKNTLLNLIEKLQKENEDYEKARKDGTLSDGYHTYNDLYYQRCVLFAAICNTNKNISWKSKRHNDGKKCFDSDNWFIVGIDTPKGSYTYHYEMKYWDLFEVQELELGKKWDGHTDKDVTRLLSLINNNIPKDKIREKLERLESQKENYKEQPLIYMLLKNQLKSLLEEE